MTDADQPTTTELAARLGDRVPSVSSLPAEAFELVVRAREFVDAVVRTDAPPAVRAAVADAIAALTDQLRAREDSPAVVIARHADGRIESFLQAGSGRLNPRAPAVDFGDLPAPPATGAAPRTVEVVATVVLGDAYSGSPGRAHGGVVAGLLDEVLGVAAYVAGASGMTVSLDVRYRAATPLNTPLTVTARWTGRDGRRSRASGEVRAGSTITADATAMFITPGFVTPE